MGRKTADARLPVRIALLVFWAWPLGGASGQPPKAGDVQRVQVVTLSMQVGSTDKETKQVTYAPPPGWYVRSHTVVCKAKQGNSSFSVNTLPQNWSWLSEERVKESYRALIDLAGQSHAAELQAKFTFEQEALLQTLRQVKATHHALVVEATARGEGFFRGGGRIDLVVTAELVYVGTEETLLQTTDLHRKKLK
jgi:hypothetical protein